MSSPQPRTKERYKYRNAAVRQATYLGLEKVVFVTMAELAHDDGIFYHGMRSIARICGISVGTAHNCIERFIKDGVWKLVRKGRPGRKGITAKYQICLDRLPIHPTVYDLAKHPDEPNCSPDERFGEPTEDENAYRSSDEPDRSNRSPDGQETFTTRTEDVDLDVDLKAQDDTTLGEQHPPLDPLEDQSQTRPIPFPVAQGPKAQGREARQPMPETAGWRPAFMEDTGESNTKSKTNGIMATPASAAPTCGTCHEPKPCYCDAGVPA
jgi:hypothetical protein